MEIPEPPAAVCDFCCAAGPVAEFAADEHHVTVSATSRSGRRTRATIPTPPCWRACPACTELIALGDEAGLLERAHLSALTHVGVLAALPREQRRRALREHKRGLRVLHSKFWAGLTPEDDDDDPLAA